jgi:hypothetical protein
MAAKDRDRVHWLMRHKRLGSWLTSPGPSMLVIHGRLTKILRRSPTSVVGAEISRRLAESGQAPIVVSGLVGEHIDRSPTWLLRSMVAALLKAHPRFDVDVLEDIKGANPNSMRDLCDIFTQLVDSLPKDNTLFILVDGLSFYADRRREAESTELLASLYYLCQNSVGCIAVKVLVTERGRLPSSIAPDGLSPEDVLVVPDCVPRTLRSIDTKVMAPLLV